MHRVILIFDMNSFFASVELRDRPALVGKPVIVGKIRRRKVVSTATPEARAFGVKKGMPTLTALALCRKYRPDTVWLPVRTLVYEDESDEIVKVVKAELVAMKFAPAMEIHGLDEAYLDLSEYCQGATADDSLNLAKPIANVLQTAILMDRKLRCKIGIASNMMMAKIATDQNSPDGINTIYDRDWTTILPPLDVNEIPGVGDVKEDRLKANGFKIIKNIQNAPANYNFNLIVGNKVGSNLKSLASGIDLRPVIPNKPRQSFSRTETFEYDTKDNYVVAPILAQFAKELPVRLKKFNMLTSLIILKYKFAGNFNDEKPKSVSKRLDVPTDSEVTILMAAINLLSEKRILDRELYSIGIAVGDLSIAGAPPPVAKPKATKLKPKREPKRKHEHQTIQMFTLPQ